MSIVASHKVSKGGHLPFFSLFLSLLFCLKIFFYIVGLRAEDLVISF